MAFTTLPLRARLVQALGSDGPAVRQTITALTIAVVTSLVAGLTLGAATGRLEDLPGLMLLVPAAIALRGNIYGAMGSRLGTAIHTGTFSISRRADTLVGQNVIASMVLTLTLALAAAIMAKVVGAGFGLTATISISDLVTISVVSGVAASAVIVVVTLVLSANAVRRGWDMDIVSGPLVSAAGDVVTLPALVAATYLVGSQRVAHVLAVLCSVVTVVAVVWAIRSRLAELRRILYESIPVLSVATLLAVIAGIAIEKQIVAFAALPALLVLVPGFLSSAGSLGSIFVARLATRLHLGLSAPTAVPDRGARTLMSSTLLLAMPLFVLVAVLVQLVAAVAGMAGPGVANLIGVALIAGVFCTLAMVAVAYYGTIAALRVGLDPDTYGIPLVTSTLDLVGAFAIIFAILTLGIS